jgi:hypothetical protein
MLISLCAAVHLTLSIPQSAGPDTLGVVTSSDTASVAQPARESAAASDSAGAGPRLGAQRIGLAPHVPLPVADADTGRRKSVEYSEWYGRRVTIHRWLSFAMLPLFATSYFSGDQILRADRRSDAPEWARTIHPVAAGSTAVLFGANTVTGVWNLWEGRHDPEGRTKRWLHAGAFMLANAGFVYAGSLGDDARENGDIRNRHRTVALSSMGLSTASWLVMLVTNR